MNGFKYFDILEAKRFYQAGGNVTAFLREQKNVPSNTSDIIETSYDLQAGTYVEYAEKNPRQASLYTDELAAILSRYVDHNDSLLDAGTGELTTLISLAAKLVRKPKNIFAFDLSWSRIYRGLEFAKRNMDANLQTLRPFVADMSEIPLLEKSITVTTSSHALEPNGGRLDELLSELFRITSKVLVLFEPCYEINSEEGRQRMDKLGYVKDIEGSVKRLNGRVVERVKIEHVRNPLNPTVAHIIVPPPPQSERSFEHTGEIFSLPGTNWPLTKLDSYYFSNETGLCFPVLKTVPILKQKVAILASALVAS